MLVLSRKSQESVIVGESIVFDPMVTVTVVAICGNTVKLGFEARRDLIIHRSEVWAVLQEGAHVGMDFVPVGG